MRRHLKRGLSVLAALVVSGGLCYLALRDVHPREVAALLAQADPAWLPALLALPFVDLLVRALRWRLILAPLASATTGKLFQLEAIGLGLNNILFLRLGEVARCYVAGRELRVPFVSVLATIFVERLLDTAALLALFTAAASMLPDAVDPRVRFWAGVLAAGLSLGLVALAWADRWLKGRPSALRGLDSRPRLRLLIEEALIGGRCLRQGHATARIVALSLCLWLSDAGVFWVGARALAFDPPLTYVKSVAVVASGAAASALPAVPGAFGNFEAAVKLILTHFGYEKSLAVGYGALVHLCMYLVVTAAGIVSLHRLGYTLGGLRSAASRRAEEA